MQRWGEAKRQVCKFVARVYKFVAEGRNRLNISNIFKIE